MDINTIIEAARRDAADVEVGMDLADIDAIMADGMDAACTTDEERQAYADAFEAAINWVALGY